MLDRYLRGVTGHVAHPIRSIQLLRISVFSVSAFSFPVVVSQLLVAPESRGGGT
jgi:hypothetical protein